MLIRLFLILALISCSESHSEPSYKFKKAPNDKIVAKVGSIEITMDEMMKGLETELYEQKMTIFNLKFNKIKEVLMDKFIEQDPKSKGMTKEQYLEKFVFSKVKVTDKEINDFIKEQNVPDTHVNAQFRAQLSDYLKRGKQREALEAWMGSKTSGDVEIYLEKPQRPTFDVKIGNAPSWGSKDAKVTLVEFSDFQCPHCAKAVETIQKLKKKYGEKKLQVVYKHFPLPSHADARSASLALMCVNEQNPKSFWKFHEHLFANQRWLANDKLKKYAKEFGVDSKKFDECLDTKKFNDYVEADVQQGISLGIRSTPTFFVNGKIVMGAQSEEVFSEVIDEELKK
ncbi:MAG: DsbA family protein [Halobacteriovoraceae bacterium]|nr:DsbA family protein [Halobacteriovoraceae bacterium]MCB9095723.1 DsbA family protein [Halobacteriovoraceae bacterium]